MSLKAIVEIALHIESFRNIDLFHQGIYYIKFRISSSSPGDKAEAIPYSLISCQIPRSKRSSKHDPHHMLSAHLDAHSFNTRAFLIRYCEEEVELNDIALFRIEISRSPDFYAAELKIESELFFSDLNGDVTPENTFEIAQQKGIEFKSVCRAGLLTKPSQGFHEFYPLVFSDNYYSTANLMIHSALLDFRFRPSPGPQAKIWLPGKKPQDLVSALFKDSKGHPKSFVGAEETDKVYQEYLAYLVASYEKLRAIILVVLGKCLTSKERDALGAPWVPVQHDFSHFHRKEFLDYLIESSPVHFSLEEIREERPELSLSSISGPEEEKPKGVSRFSERVASHDSKVIAARLFQDINAFSGQLFQLWHKLADLLKLSHRTLSALLQESFQEKFKERWGESIIRKIYRTTDFSLAADENIGATHELLALQRRTDRVYRETERLPVHEAGLFPLAELHPILFEDICVRDKQSLNISQPQLIEDTPEFYESCISFQYQGGKMYRGIHLMVLVHGFQGNHFDMRLMKNNIALVHPEALFLCSNSNEDFTEGDIGEMGVRLAQEVMNFVSEWCPEKTLGRLSFIGHSMGGLIIRASLPYLETFSGKMHMLLTFSSPHLGYMYNSSRIIDAGIWFLKKWRKSKCLQQLSMSDSDNLRHSFVYELSNKKGLGWFKHLVLVSSYQDQYAPYDSARIEVSKQANRDPKRKEMYQEMVMNLLSGMTAETLHRLDINFKISEKSLDTLIGRAAHIQFLENQTIMKMIIYRYPEFFG